MENYEVKNELKSLKLNSATVKSSQRYPHFPDQKCPPHELRYKLPDQVSFKKIVMPDFGTAVHYRFLALELDTPN